MLKQQLKDDLKKSMLSRETEKTSVLRMLISAVGYFEIQKGGAGYEATDEDVLTVIQKEAKQRRDSIEQFKNGGRNDLAAKEEQELGILQTYLPEEMSEEEITKLVEEVIAQTKTSSLQDLGKIMKILIPKTNGKADGGLVSRIVRSKLT